MSAHAVPALFGADNVGSGPGGGGHLYTINPGTGVATLIGSANSSDLNGITCTRGGDLFGSLGAGGSGEIVTLDRTDGSGTPLGASGFNTVPALSTSPLNTIYGSAGAGTCADQLVTVDPLTGAATAVGGTFGGGVNDIDGMQGIAFDPAGNLFGVTNSCDTFGPGPALYSINPATGLATLIGRVLDGTPSPPTASVEGLTFLPDGTLLASTGGGVGDILRIDPATGVFTLVGNAGTGQSIVALSFCGCDSAPVTAGCALPGKSLVTIKNNVDDKRDKLLWKWNKGTATTADFGSPVTGGTAFILCVYDDLELVLNAAVGAGGTCGTKPCWKALSTKGFGYKNSAGNGDGIAKLLVKSGAGNAKILLKGTGINLGPPDLPLVDASAVTVQLFKTDGPECWEAAFQSTALVNKTDQFKDKTP